MHALDRKIKKTHVFSLFLGAKKRSLFHPPSDECVVPVVLMACLARSACAGPAQKAWRPASTQYDHLPSPCQCRFVIAFVWPPLFFFFFCINKQTNKKKGAGFLNAVLQASAAQGSNERQPQPRRAWPSLATGSCFASLATTNFFYHPLQ